MRKTLSFVLLFFVLWQCCPATALDEAQKENMIRFARQKYGKVSLQSVSEKKGVMVKAFGKDHGGELHWLLLLHLLPHDPKDHYNTEILGMSQSLSGESKKLPDQLFKDLWNLTTPLVEGDPGQGKIRTSLHSSLFVGSGPLNDPEWLNTRYDFIPLGTVSCFHFNLNNPSAPKTDHIYRNVEIITDDLGMIIFDAKSGLLTISR